MGSICWRGLLEILTEWSTVSRKFLNPGTRITKKGFEFTIPRMCSSKREGEVRIGWDITERIEELLPKRVLCSDEIKL